MAKFTCNFISYVLTRTVDITVIIPSVTIPEAMNEKNKRVTHNTGHKYPVLYLLHGMGNNHATWTGYSNIELYAEERNIAVVMLSAENKSYVNHENGDLFYDFVETELQDFVCSMFPVSERWEDTYIAGLSMGGFGALVHGLTNPEKYCAVGAFSSAILLNPSEMSGGEKKEVPEEYKVYSIVEKLQKSGKRLPKLFLACGRNDFLYEDNEKFARYLETEGFDVTWVVKEGYGHEWRFWDQMSERYLDFIPRTDYYSAMGKRMV